MRNTFHFVRVVSLFCMLFSAMAIHSDEYIDIETKPPKPCHLSSKSYSKNALSCLLHLRAGWFFLSAEHTYLIGWSVMKALVPKYEPVVVK